MIDVGVDMTPAAYALLGLLGPEPLSIDGLCRRLGWTRREFADALHVVREQGLGVATPGDGTIRLMPRSLRHAGELAAENDPRHTRQ